MTPAGIGLAEPFRHQNVHQFVGNQQPGPHALLDGLPDIVAAADMFPQHVSGRDLGNAQTFDEELRLGTLPRTGRPKKNNGAFDGRLIAIRRHGARDYDFRRQFG